MCGIRARARMTTTLSHIHAPQARTKCHINVVITVMNSMCYHRSICVLNACAENSEPASEDADRGH